MKVNCAYKFELILKPEQRAKCAQFVGNCRYVYNKAVEIQLRRLETKQPFVSYKELASQLVGWKKDDSRRVLQIALLPSKADFIHLEGLCGATKST